MNRRMYYVSLLLVCAVAGMLLHGCKTPDFPPIPVPTTTTTTIPMPVPVPTPVPVVIVDTNEAAHGLDMQSALQHGQYAFKGAVTAQLLTADTSGGGCNATWTNPSRWQYNAYCDGVLFVCWQQGGGWNYGYTEWKKAGNGGYSFGSGSLNNIVVGYGAVIAKGDIVGFGIGSTKGERSNIVFSPWPL